jgi:RNA polymerase sigma-70 factor, ECF subfamily
MGDETVEPTDPALIDLRLALRELPTRQGEVVVLHYLLDLPVREVAEWLGLSPGGVKHALFRARQSLADVLTSEEVI